MWQKKKKAFEKSENLFVEKKTSKSPEGKCPF